jgi:multidrug efflux system membrane fusion protein
MTRTTRIVLAAALVIAVLAVIRARSSSPPAAAGPGAGGRGKIQFPVEVTPVQTRRVEYTVNAVGSVEAFEVVQVTARVAGQVEQVRFAEGETARPGQVLVEIEPERFRLAVQSARATYERAEAAKSDARAALSRREGVNASNPGLIPGEELETWRTRVRTTTAEAAQARAMLDLAELNLRDAFVRVPFTGVIQTRTVQTGQYVQPGTTLATLVRRDPLLLRFSVPEQDASGLRSGMAARFTARGSERAHSARIASVAEAADVASRMVAVTAEVDDPDKEALRPGTFAQVTVPVGSVVDAPVIPQTAVRPSERGFLAYVVEGNVAKSRVLILGMRTADGLVEVREGLKPGEMLVVRGSEALFEGAAVRVPSAGKPEGPKS